MAATPVRSLDARVARDVVGVAGRGDGKVGPRRRRRRADDDLVLALEAQKVEPRTGPRLFHQILAELRVRPDARSLGEQICKDTARHDRERFPVAQARVDDGLGRLVRVQAHDRGAIRQKRGALRRPVR